MKDVEVQLVYKAPSRGNNEFSLDHAAASFGTLTVQNPDAALPSFAPVTTAINNRLAEASIE